MKRPYLIVAASVIMSCLSFSACKTGIDTPPGGDCGSTKTVCLHKTVHAGVVNGTSEFFELETPEARNDCEAQYSYYFRWANPAKRVIDNDMPPIEDLAHAFQPGAEFAYFPHPAPTFGASIAKTDCNGNAIPGDGWWYIDFSIGNKNSSLPTTRYYVRSRLDPAVASTLDSTEIYCEIGYYDKPKQN